MVNAGPEKHIQQYFSNIFSAQETNYEEILVEPKINSSHQQIINAPFSTDAVKKAVFEMHPNKSPGPDRFNLGFHQSFWDTVGTDVAAFCIQGLEHGTIPMGLNDSNIILIP